MNSSQNVHNTVINYCHIPHLFLCTLKILFNLIVNLKYFPITRKRDDALYTISLLIIFLKMFIACISIYFSEWQFIPQAPQLPPQEQLPLPLFFFFTSLIIIATKAMAIIDAIIIVAIICMPPILQVTYFHHTCFCELTYIIILQILLLLQLFLQYFLCQ